MDEQTEELREIFLSASDETTLTERQESSRGALGSDEGETSERLAAVIGRMRAAYSFRTDLDGDRLGAVVRAFYAGDDDQTIAATLDVDEETVVTARLDLHLVREADLTVPFDPAACRSMFDAGDDDETVAERLGAPVDVVAHYRTALAAEREARQASHRYRSEFEDALPDAVISANHTAGVHEDGLEDATEGMETNVSF